MLLKGQIVKHPYMGTCFSYIKCDSKPKAVYTEYVNVINPQGFEGKHVLATVENGRATVKGLDPEADN